MEVVRARVRAADDEVARTEFLAWIGPHWETMRRVAWRLSQAGEAEDVLQNAALAAWRHRDRFDDARGSAAAWLTTITVNEARKSRRFARRAETTPHPGDGGAAEVGIDVRRAIGRLPRRQALAVELHYYAGLPIRDTALVMGCAEGTVKSTLAAARTALQRLLGEDYR